jgi:protein-L-isoaspartate(D-aspartate) O-methyltransferase
LANNVRWRNVNARVVGVQWAILVFRPSALTEKLSAPSTPGRACGSAPGTGEKSKFFLMTRARVASIDSDDAISPLRELAFRERSWLFETDMAVAPNPPEKMMFQLSLRRRGISDQAVLRAMEEVPREAFVTAADRDDAYRDSALGIACGQTISQPFVVAYMTEQLGVQRPHRVLEIGTGSGYQAAVLSRLCRDVVSIERYRTLAESARARLTNLGYDNIEVIVGDGFDVPDNAGTFDRIIVTAAMEQIPEKLLERLEPGGVLIAPVGPHHGVQTLVRIVRTETGFERKELVDVRFVPALPGIAREL